MCTGCRRPLCIDAPNKQIQKVKAKVTKQTTTMAKGGQKRRKVSKPEEITIIIRYHKHFHVDTPVLDASGKVERESNGNPKYEREYGIYSCYHLAHRKAWKRHILETRADLIEDLKTHPRTRKAKGKGPK